MERQIYDCRLGFSQSYLLSRIVRNGQRPTKVPFFIREIRFNSLRWTEPVSVILQISGLAALLAALRALARLSPQRLSPRRPFSCSPLCYRGWNWPDRERPVADSQRFDPAASGLAGVSSPRHLEELSLALWSQRTSKSQSRSRPSASGVFLPPGASLQRYCGCRYHSADHLRFSRRHGGGLHPQETPWPSFLRSDHLQRRAPRFEFGHGTQSRQYPRLLGSLGFSESGLGQTPFLGGVHAHTGTTRWSFLRQNQRRVPRQEAAGATSLLLACPDR